MSDASIQITIKWTQAGAIGDGSVEDSVTPGEGRTLTGTGSASGAETDADIPDGSGGSEHRHRSRGLPDGATFTEARADVSRSCPDGNTIRLSGTGNVSASARLDGECIVLTLVNTRPLAGGGVETKTVTTRRCCAGGSSRGVKRPRG
jgi:hypothetical protein